MQKVINTNERELVGKISEWFNEVINRNNFPFKSASIETSVKVNDKKTRFGDLILWKDRESSEAFSLIEVKPPFKAKENLETFREKAVQLKLKYAFTWDFQSFNVYKVKDNEISFIDSETTPVLNKLNDWLNPLKQVEIKSYIGRICNEIISLNEKEKFTKFYPDKIYFVNFIRSTVEKLIPKYERFLRGITRTLVNKRIVFEYAKKQGIAYPSDADYYDLIAKQSVYGFVTRIIFYLTIKKYFDDLPDLLVEEPDLGKLIKTSFAKARDKDWQAVFEEGPIEQIGIPVDIYDDLREFFSELKVYHFGELAEDVIGEIFQEIIDPNQRHSLGQYFTNEDLVDLIIGFAVKDKNGFYCDPTCGSGTFLIRLYDRLRYLNQTNIKHTELLNRIWGFDLGKFPAELSTINLFRQNISNFENFPRVLCEDIFNVEKEKVFKFPPPNASKHFSKVEMQLPAFQGIVGNFPYIRQELIEKEVKGYKKFLTKVIAREYFLTYPELFETKGLQYTHLEALKKEVEEKQKKEIDRYVEANNIELKLSGQADIYAYIFLHTSTFLTRDGTTAIITSNSWLDVSYGYILKEFFLSHFKVKAIIASWAEPWFEDAAVNTIITILDKEKDSIEREGNVVKFIKLKKKLADLIPYPDLQTESIKRWQCIDGIVDFVELAEYHANVNEVTDKIKSIEDERFQIRLIKQKDLNTELDEKKENSKWGKYLRAPDVYFEIIDKCEDKLIPLKDIADVRRGYTTGINEFFYLKVIEQEKNGLLKCRNDRGWEGLIEEKYLKPVIKSPKESDCIIIDPAKLKYQIFICNRSKAELKKEGDLYALKYIEWGEKQKTSENTKWTEVPSVESRKYWYGIVEKEPGFILLQMINNDRFLAFVNAGRVQVDHNLFEFLIEDKKYIDTAKKFLNSYLFALIKEVNSRVNLGDGATKTEGIDWNNLMLVPKESMNIKIKTNKIFERKALSVDEEIKQKDRIELDKAVLNALGLHPEVYLDKIYSGLTELVKERLELPKMRKKKKEQTKEKAYDEIKESVIKDCLENGIKQFPEYFYTSGNYDELQFAKYPTNGKPLAIESFFNNFEMKDKKGKTVFVVESENKAEFAKILSQKEIFEIKIPKEEKVIEEILANHNLYIENLEKELEADAHQKLHDWLEAEKMAKEIMEEYGIT